MINFKELDSEQRKIYLNSCQVYKVFMDELKLSNQFQGGMRWKKTGNVDYLFQTRAGTGLGKSMGRRSAETEKIYNQFHLGKLTNKERLKSLKESVSRQSRLCVAIGGINRVPKTSAQIIRLLDREGLLGTEVSVLGTHAIYAYEAAAGVMMDVDLLFNVQRELKLSSELNQFELIGLLKQIDKSFEIAPDGYRAINEKGFIVELVIKRTDLNSTAPGLNWLDSAPAFRKTAIGKDGLPVDLVVPDPRYFSLNKLWLSELADRDPVKRQRDFLQAKAVADISLNYLNLSFDNEFLKVFPEFIRNKIHDLLSGIDGHSESLDMLLDQQLREV